MGVLRYEEPVDATIVGADIELYGLAGIDWYLEGNLFQYQDDALSEGVDIQQAIQDICLPVLILDRWSYLKGRFQRQ